jgi:hypothetical protein
MSCSCGCNCKCSHGCDPLPCHNCCTTTSTTSTTTIPCIGELCDELYDCQCVKYKGPDLTCYGIEDGTTLCDIIKIITDELCKSPIPPPPPILDCRFGNLTATVVPPAAVCFTQDTEDTRPYVSTVFFSEPDLYNGKPWFKPLISGGQIKSVYWSNTLNAWVASVSDASSGPDPDNDTIVQILDNNDNDLPISDSVNQWSPYGIDGLSCGSSITGIICETKLGNCLTTTTTIQSTTTIAPTTVAPTTIAPVDTTTLNEPCLCFFLQNISAVNQSKPITTCPQDGVPVTGPTVIPNQSVFVIMKQSEVNLLDTQIWLVGQCG